MVAQSIAFLYAPRATASRTRTTRSGAEAARDLRAVMELERQVPGADGPRGMVLRYGWFYGPGTCYAPGRRHRREVRKRQSGRWAGATGEWPFIHIDDAARATVAAVEGGAPGVYNVVDDEPAPLREWLPAFAEAIGAKKPLRVPKFVARLAAGKMATHYGTTHARRVEREGFKRELAWQPRYASWREGFREGLG